MNHYIERKDQSWGTYDYVDHGHDNRVLAPDVDLMGVGDYESSVPVMPLGNLRSFGEPAPDPFAAIAGPLASAVSSLAGPVVRGGVQYVEPTAQAFVLAGLRASIFTPGPDGATGTLTPLLPGQDIPSWAEETAKMGGAALIEVPAVNVFSIRAARVFDATALLELAGEGKPFAIVAIDPRLEGEVSKFAGGGFPWMWLLGGAAVVGTIGLIVAASRRR